MKKIFLATIILLFSAGLTLSTKAQSKTVNIESISTLKTTDKIPVTVMPVYNKAGKLMYTVKRYEAAALPKSVSRLITNEYYDFDIAGVEEVVLPSDKNSIYLVHITNDKKLKTVRVYNGESEVIKEYKKG